MVFTCERPRFSRFSMISGSIILRHKTRVDLSEPRSLSLRSGRERGWEEWEGKGDHNYLAKDLETQVNVRRGPWLSFNLSSSWFEVPDSR